MSKIAVKQPIPKSLDMAALEALVEPLMIQVNRVKGGAFTPITMPQGDQGEPAGTGWTKDMVRELNNGWLAREWCGGGAYQMTVTDASSPPQTLTWQSWWPPNEYGPERAPGTPRMEAAPAANVVPITSAQPQPAQVSHMPPFVNGLPQLPPQPYVAPQQYAQPMPYYPQPPVYQPQMPAMSYYGQQQAMNAAEQARREADARIAQMEAALRQAQLDAQKREFDAQLERERREHATALQRLEAQIASLAAAQTTRGTSPEVEAIREQNRVLAQQLAAAEKEREYDRREREAREAMERVNQGVQQQIAQMQQQHQQTIQALQQQTSRGPDPMIQLLIEQNRNSMDAMKEISRQSASAVEKLQPFMMNPRDMMLMQKEASTGMDQITQKMATAFGSALEMQQKVLESSLQLNQGGSPVVDLVREGVANVKELAERYVTTTNRAKQIEAQAQADIEKAKAHQITVQAQRDVAIANANRMPPPQPLPPPRPAQPLAGPNGQNAQNFEAWRRQQEQQAAQPQPQPRETAGVAPQPTPTAPAPTTAAARPTNGQRSDFQWFGPAMGEVMQVRQRVDAFMKKMQAAAAGQDVQLVEDDASPNNVAQGILAAAAMVQAQNIPIPAMTELLGQGRYLEFVKLLIPAAPETFHEDVVTQMKILTGEIDPEAEAEAAAEAAAEAQEDADADADDGDDDGMTNADGSPSEQVVDGSAGPKKPTIRVINPNQPRA